MLKNIEKKNNTNNKIVTNNNYKINFLIKGE